jgi:peptidoglycan/xylan/chitin deacetylase (PgdA/CDA1 family)
VTKMLSTLILVLAGLYVPSFSQTEGPRTKPQRAVAVTFDDLPYVAAGRDPYLPHAQQATSQILRVLKAHRAPAIGFVNENKLHAPGELDRRVALLQQWIDAGMMLGNHTYSHADFNRWTVQQFQDEIIKGEIITRRLMHSRQPYSLYFRHPMTHTGDTKEKKEAIEQFLAARSYRVAPYTIENSDFVFNAGYVRALAAKDEALSRRLRDTYLAHTMAVTDFAETLSVPIFGREVTQTLLLHVNDITADCLDEMLSRYGSRGYRFVTLDEAMNDPAYQTKDTLVSKYGPSWLWRWMKSLGMNLSFAGDPEPPQWVMESSRQ